MIQECLFLKVFTDGDEHDAFFSIKATCEKEWSLHYERYIGLKIGDPVNLKNAANRVNLPDGLVRIERIRNPDIFFYETSMGIELGGIEITTHSPDGSNIEKRYPFLWAAPESKTNAFVVTPYLKRRPSGQINRFPRRHAERNQQFIAKWEPKNPCSYLRQYVPLHEIHMGDLALVPDHLREHLLRWSDLGMIFAHLLAASALNEDGKRLAIRHLSQWKQRLTALAQLFVENAVRKTEASTLIKFPDRWIQVYNSRPDSGHWERGEGQFDSIDGRVMFTLDELSIHYPEKKRPSLELWLPQMVRNHAWITEQKTRGYESKRLRNLLVELADKCTTKFADELTKDDWAVLQENSRLMLERLDWKPETFHVSSLIMAEEVGKIARAGITHASQTIRNSIEIMLRDETLYYCAVRGYTPNWEALIEEQIGDLPVGAKVLVPRLGEKMLEKVKCPEYITLVSGDACSKEQLMMLRQLHRHLF